MQVDQIVIGTQELSALLPHSGSMCLLDSIHSWDDKLISCWATSHRSVDNPLREDNQLPVHAGIEYAAQAMAAHGALCDSKKNNQGRITEEPKLGYLVVLTGVEWFCSRLDDLLGELLVKAERLMVVDGGFSYQFNVYHQDQLLLQGRAVVALQNE
ncbi:MAG: hypothetical protein WCY88_15075 [Spongiibacteraceae bacterium]